MAKTKLKIDELDLDQIQYLINKLDDIGVDVPTEDDLKSIKVVDVKNELTDTNMDKIIEMDNDKRYFESPWDPETLFFYDKKLDEEESYITLNSSEATSILSQIKGIVNESRKISIELDEKVLEARQLQTTNSIAKNFTDKWNRTTEMLNTLGYELSFNPMNILNESRAEMFTSIMTNPTTEVNRKLLESLATINLIKKQNKN